MNSHKYTSYVQKSTFSTMKNFCLRIIHLFLWVMVTSGESWFNPLVFKTVLRGGPQDEYMLNMTNPEVIRRYGYPCEIHHINVSNYRLEMHRIPQGLNQSIPSKGYAVVLIHGFTSSANVFSASGPNSAISYFLADNGYDVWIANLRGNQYTRFNYNISADDPDFWKYSLDEHINGDLPNMIDYILNFTGTSKLYLVGHSSGNIIVMGLLASQVEYNDKVKAVIALGPINIAGHQMEIPMLSSIINLILNIIPDGQFLGEINSEYYKNELFNIIRSVVFLNQIQLYGDKPSGFDQESLSLTLYRMLSSESLQVLKHCLQFGLHGFRKYDYGSIHNLQMYKTPSPPLYSLTNILAPIYIYSAANDKLASKTHSLSLCDSIPSCRGVFIVGSWYSGHTWLLIGKDTKTALFPMVLSAMNYQENITA